MSFRSELRNRNNATKAMDLDADLVRIADTVLAEVKEHLSRIADAGGKGALLTVVDIQVSNEAPDYYPDTDAETESGKQCGTVHLRTNRDIKDLYSLLNRDAAEEGIMVELVSTSLLKERYSLRFSLSI